MHRRLERAWLVGDIKAGQRQAKNVRLPSKVCDPQAVELMPEVSILLVADNHTHELGGRRFPGQREFADAVVSVAMRGNYRS